MQNAIISVSDKTGVIDFARALFKLGNWRIYSTGGTARTLLEAGVPVVMVSELTKFPECLDGRVKTLHPAVHAGILAKKEPEHQKTMADLGLPFIDMVVVNLYPFQETVDKPDSTFQQIIENIDIGGPTMLRAAAKNFGRVTVICDPSDYQGVMSAMQEHGDISVAQRQELALKVFRTMYAYDEDVADFLGGCDIRP